MTETDALIRARALLQEPVGRAPGAGAALVLSLLMSILAMTAAGAVIFWPAPAQLTAGR